MAEDKRDAFQKTRDEIRESINLGIAAEEDDEILGPIVKSFNELQLSWVASWLAGDGFGKIKGSTKKVEAIKKGSLKKVPHA